MFAVILAIMTAILLVVMLYNTYKKLQVDIQAKGKKKYEQLCPDYWELVDQGYDNNGNVNSIRCRNVHELGKCALEGDRIYVLSDPIFYDPKTSDKAKCKWAKACDISWQGFDNKC